MDGEKYHTHMSLIYMASEMLNQNDMLDDFIEEHEEMFNRMNEILDAKHFDDHMEFQKVLKNVCKKIILENSSKIIQFHEVSQNYEKMGQLTRDDSDQV